MDELVTAIDHDDPVVAMRAADALEKATEQWTPAQFAPFKPRLLRIAAQAEQQEARWHLAQIAPRLALTPRERASLLARLESWLDDPSAIVRACALEAIVRLANDGEDEDAHAHAQTLLADALTSNSAAVRARARRLLR